MEKGGRPGSTEDKWAYPHRAVSPAINYMIPNHLPYVNFGRMRSHNCSKIVL